MLKAIKSLLRFIRSGFMDDCYHVYLDNTNAPETVPGIFKWVGPQNWYVVKARDTEHAKAIVLNLFRHHGDAVMARLSRCLSATKSKVIYDHLKNAGVNLWSYIPHGNYRQPGQQPRYPSVEEIARTDANGHSVSRNYVPPKPVVPEGQDDSNIQVSKSELGAEDAAIVNSNPQMPANMNPQQMMQMMQQMMSMMGMQPQGLPTDEDVNSVQGSVPISQDPKLQEELRNKMDKIITKPRGEDVSPDEALGGDIDISQEF